MHHNISNYRYIECSEYDKEVSGYICVIASCGFSASYCLYWKIQKSI